MAEAGRQHERFTLDGANVEVQPQGGLLGIAGKKSFASQIMNISQGGLQFLCKKDVQVKEKDRLNMTIHLKKQANWLKTPAEVVWVRDVPAKNFRRVGCRFVDMGSAGARNLRETQRDYMPRQEEELAGATGRLLRSMALPPLRDDRDVEEAVAAEKQRFGRQGAEDVRRPVKLLELLSMLETFEVTDDLIQGVLEAVTQNISIEQLFGQEDEEDVRPRRVTEEETQEEQPEARPLPIFRLSRETRIHFNEDGMPVAPPVAHIFYPKFDSSECFGCELRTDRMLCEDAPVSFKPGDVLIFRANAKPESGDYVFGQTKTGNVFLQFFEDSPDQIRLRPLNPKYPEAVLKHSEFRNCCKLIARLQEL